MEAYGLTADIIILTLSNPANKSLSQKVINYLDPEDLKTINQELQKSQSQNNSFTSLIRTYYFLTNFLNKVDRTFYYSFYEEEQFHNIEIKQNALLVNNYSNCFLQFPKQYRQCLIFIQKLFPDIAQPVQFAAELERMITDTDIPMPKLKRQNQGIFCKTSFQNYLIYLKFKNQPFHDYQQVFENIHAYFQVHQEAYLQKLFLKSCKDPMLHKKILSLRFTPYQITYQNLGSYLVEHNSLHNLLAAIFALTDVWLTSVKSYISSLQDPFHKYVELITRYSIYRNYVLSVEQNLSFVFQEYNELYSQVFGSNKPTYRFWKPAMTKWTIKFEQFHSQCSSVYYYCLTKLRTNSALEYFQKKQVQEAQTYIVRTIKNKMALREYEIQLNETLFPAQISNGVEDFFQQDPQQYQIILVQFAEYLIDLSINQENVHWCGHSEQILSQPYQSFEKYILAENKMYLNYIRDLMSGINSKVHITKLFYQQEVQYLQTLQFKPLTLKKFVECYNQELSDLPILNQNYEGIIYECKVSDQTLRYFNEKANIKFKLTEEQMLFYSITPLISADELLSKSKSISTTNDSEAMQAEEDSDCENQYFSSSDIDEYNKQKELDAEMKQKQNKKMEECSGTMDSNNGMDEILQADGYIQKFNQENQEEEMELQKYGSENIKLNFKIQNYESQISKSTSQKVYAKHYTNINNQISKNEYGSLEST